jgi:hypothetical protein
MYPCSIIRYVYWAYRCVEKENGEYACRCGDCVCGEAEDYLNCPEDCYYPGSKDERKDEYCFQNTEISGKSRSVSSAIKDSSDNDACCGRYQRVNPEIVGLNLPPESWPPVDEDLRPYLQSSRLQVWEIDDGLKVDETGYVRPDMPINIPAGQPIKLNFSFRLLTSECQPVVSEWEKENPDSRWVVWPNLLSGSNSKKESKTLVGDANGDDRVDELDYAIWHYSYGKSTEGDFNNDGVTDEVDYTLWWQNFGKNPGN